jgi:diaminohydroxyphosphoribosylaminopyrimidine deaminase/5-amino-6-(5-phosphoribosylamino)uracil reductase
VPDKQQFTQADHVHMARAIRLARLGLYTTDPNPRVGCVLVQNGEVVGEGWHRKTGELHAERIALGYAGSAARDATAYVTLEPCSHHGRTPPCADGLIEAGVSRVVAAMPDPNPLVAGQGMFRLRDAGVHTETGLLQSEAERLNPGFIKRMQTGRPYVRCKLAMSLDGRTAMANGESVWITGDAAREDVQRLRARSSAIMTGVGTVLADNPSMNIRLGPSELDGVESREYLRQPLRVVLDSRLRMPTDSKMLLLDGETLILHDAVDRVLVHALEQAGARLQQVAANNSGLALDQVMVLLGETGINEVLIEAGPTLAGAALQAGIVDELVIYMAPSLMGAEARGLFNLPGLDEMADRVQLQIQDIRKVGQDFRIIAKPKTGE